VRLSDYMNSQSHAVEKVDTRVNMLFEVNGIMPNGETILCGTDCTYDSNKKRARKSMSVFASRRTYEMGHSGASPSYCQPCS